MPVPRLLTNPQHRGYLVADPETKQAAVIEY
jgi:hypothetical protein